MGDLFVGLPFGKEGQDICLTSDQRLNQIFDSFIFQL